MNMNIRTHYIRRMNPANQHPNIPKALKRYNNYKETSDVYICGKPQTHITSGPLYRIKIINQNQHTYL